MPEVSEGWTLREMLRLPKKAIEGLAGVMQAVEESLALPTQICVNVVALLGKPNGAGERPITLTECLYAKNMASYKNETRRWDDDYHGWWDDALKGNRAFQSGLLRRIYEKVSTLNEQPAVCTFVDSVLAQTHRYMEMDKSQHAPGRQRTGAQCGHVWVFTNSTLWLLRKDLHGKAGLMKAAAASGPRPAARLGSADERNDGLCPRWLAEGLETEETIAHRV